MTAAVDPITIGLYTFSRDKPKAVAVPKPRVRVLYLIRSPTY